MKVIAAFIFSVFAFNIIFAQPLSNRLDSVSYVIGHMMAESIVNQGVKKINSQALILALEEALAGKRSSIDRAEGSRILTSYMNDMLLKEQEHVINAGKEFLAQNALNPGVIQLESGLQYKIIEEGDGPSPGSSDKVTTHYIGKLIDGTVFDSSIERGNPISFKVNGVIKGWQEALPMMKTGSKWMLYIPYDLGYGARGAGASIPPYSTLIFEIELLSID